MKTSFLGAPSQDWPRQTDRLRRMLTSSLFLEVLLAAFLKKRMATLVNGPWSTLNLILLIHALFLRTILKYIPTGFSGIQTHDLCLVTGTPSLPKSAVFKTFVFKWFTDWVCFMTANRWKLIGCYQQTFSRLFKENAVCNWLLYQPLEKDSVLILLTLILENFFL